MNSTKNLIGFIAAMLVAVAFFGTASQVFAAGSTAVYSTYTYPSASNTSNSNDGGNYNSGCCTSSGSSNGSTAVYATYSYPATTYTTSYTTTSSGGATNTHVVYTPSCSVTVNKGSVVAGETVTVSWNSSNANTSRSITHFGSVGTSGSRTFVVTESTTFSGTFKGSGGTAYCSAQVFVTQQTPAPTCTITSTPSSVTPGQAVTINWNTTNANNGSISGIGSVNTSGSYVVYPTQNTTYTGTFYGQNGQQVTCSTNVVVNTIQCPAGYTGTYPNCVPVQYCPSGYTGTYPNCVPPQQNLSCTISISNYGQGYNNGYWNPNSAVTLSWNSNSASTGFINNGFGNVGPTGSRTVYPTQTTTYTGTFYGYNGQQVTCSATVYVNSYVPPVTPNTPYVTLSAVPYTGLELGPVGTVVYWGFIAIWCAIAAYLIVVKKVQNSVYRSLKSVLFGAAGGDHAPAHAAPAAHTSHIAHAKHEVDATDAFITAQINRARN